MTLTAQSLVVAVKRKAARAHAKVLTAKANLDAANHALAAAVPANDIAKVAAAAKRTVAAEAEVERAAEELDAVNHLLEDNTGLHAEQSGEPGKRSGQGSKSLMPHLKQKNAGTER